MGVVTSLQLPGHVLGSWGQCCPSNVCMPEDGYSDRISAELVCGIFPGCNLAPISLFTLVSINCSHPRVLYFWIENVLFYTRQCTGKAAAAAQAS